MTWIVTANSNLCRIYQYDKNPKEIALVKEINHPENKLKKGDLLTSERAGRYQTADSARGGAYSPRTDPKEVEIDHFLRDVAVELNQGRNAQAYSNLIVIIPAHMHGILSGHLDKHVKLLIKKEIQKDVMHLSQPEFLDFLRNNLTF